MKQTKRTGAPHKRGRCGLRSQTQKRRTSHTLAESKQFSLQHAGELRGGRFREAVRLVRVANGRFVIGCLVCGRVTALDGDVLRQELGGEPLLGDGRQHIGVGLDQLLRRADLLRLSRDALMVDQAVLRVGLVVRGLERFLQGDEDDVLRQVGDLRAIRKAACGGRGVALAGLARLLQSCCGLLVVLAGKAALFLVEHGLALVAVGIGLVELRLEGQVVAQRKGRDCRHAFQLVHCCLKLHGCVEGDAGNELGLVLLLPRPLQRDFLGLGQSLESQAAQRAAVEVCAWGKGHQLFRGENSFKEPGGAPQ
eukprot:m.182405 g.182405  ORF g.182405 m.182405 type:complete len:309 (-) comp17459_c2_seq5:907-1833(-)